jgi:hypothetical protein
MCIKDSKESITAEITVASIYTLAVSARTTSHSFAGSVVTPEHRTSATIRLTEVTSLTMPDTTDALISGIDCTPSEGRGIRTGRREYTFVGATADLSRMPRDLQAMREEPPPGIPLRSPPPARSRRFHNAFLSGLLPFPKPVCSGKPTYTRKPLWAAPQNSLWHIFFEECKFFILDILTPLFVVARWVRRHIYK